MTDTAALPEELWALIAGFLDLDNDSLAKFKLICKTTYSASHQAMILQPLYNRLYALDKTLPPILPKIEADVFAAFKEAFLKIQKSQEEEINYLKKHHAQIIRLKSKYTSVFQYNKPTSLTSLKARDAILDELNSDIITTKIHIQLTDLSLNNICITRLPITLFEKQGYLDFWKNLARLDCTGNQLTSLDVRKLEALKELYCGENRLVILNVKNLKLLETLDCHANNITELNLEGLSKLQQLIWLDNPLVDLNLTDVPAQIKKKLSVLEKKLLCAQLDKVLSEEERQCIITRLGPETIIQNNMHNSTAYSIQNLASDIFSKAMDYVPSFPSIPSFSFFSSSTEIKMEKEEQHNKRKRSQDNDDESNKRRRI